MEMNEELRFKQTSSLNFVVHVIPKIVVLREGKKD